MEARLIGGGCLFKILEEEKAQGATEYLLILAGVLVVVAIAIWYVTQLGGKAQTAAENQENDIFDNLTQ